MKKYIPNILTTYRLIIAIAIPFIFVYTNYYLFMSLFVSAVISDLFDGYLARKWDVTSQYGRFADVIADKLFAIISVLILLIFHNKYFSILLIGEGIIMLTNLMIYIFCGNIEKKNFDNRNSSIYGKFKTIILFITLVIGYLSYEIEALNILILPLIIVSFILQIITAIYYYMTRN